MKNKLKMKKNEFKYRRFLQKQIKEQNETYNRFMIEKALERKFEMKSEIQDQLQELKQNGPEVFLAKKKKKSSQSEPKVNNALVFGSDE